MKGARIHVLIIGVMGSQIEFSIKILSDYLSRKSNGIEASVDRDEVVAHATLSAWVHHWPSEASSDVLRLLLETSRIREAEQSRWMTQRRLALAKLSKAYLAQELTI